MPKDATSGLPQPIFNEGNVTPDPTRFKTAHPSDTRQYKEIEKLLKTQVVGFDPSRVAPDDLFQLESAFGPHGPEVVKLSSTPPATLVLRTKESTGTRLPWLIR